MRVEPMRVMSSRLRPMRGEDMDVDGQPTVSNTVETVRELLAADPASRSKWFQTGETVVKTCAKAFWTRRPVCVFVLCRFPKTETSLMHRLLDPDDCHTTLEWSSGTTRP